MCHMTYEICHMAYGPSFLDSLPLSAAAARSRGLVSRLRISVVVIAQPADHHFFPGLLAPFHILRRIGVIFVARRVVEMGGAFDLRPFRNRERLFGHVVSLPVEILARPVQQDPGRPVGEGRLISKSLPRKCMCGIRLVRCTSSLNV